MTPQEYFYNSSDKFKVCETWSYAMVKFMFEFAEHYHYHEEGLKVMARIRTIEAKYQFEAMLCRIKG